MATLHRGHGLGWGVRGGFGEERAEVETAVGVHHIGGGFLVAHPLELGPFGRIAIPRELEAVEVRVVQIEREVGTVVVVAIDPPTAVEQPLVGDRQILAGRVIDGEVIEPGTAACGGLPTKAFPGVQRDVMVIPASGKKGGGAHVDEQVEAKQVTVEGDRSVEVGNLEVHVADMRSGWDGLVSHG